MLIYGDDKDRGNEDSKSKKYYSRKTIRDKLFDHRTVFLEGEIAEDYISYLSVRPRAVRDILTWLDSQNNKPIKLIINSPGGFLSEGLAVIDIMQTIKSPVWTICLNRAASMAAIILAYGKKGHRYIFPYSLTLLHLPRGGTTGDSREVEIFNKQMQKMKDRLVNILVRHTNQKDRKKILKDMDRDKWMYAKETVKYGLADHVVKSIEELNLLPKNNGKKNGKKKNPTSKEGKK